MKANKTQYNYEFFASFFLPDGMIDWFEITKVEEENLGLKGNGFSEYTTYPDAVILQNTLRFEEIPVSNDVMFHARLMGSVSSDQILWYPKLVYSWIQRKESITHIPSVAKAVSRFNASLRANRYAADHGWGKFDYTSHYLRELKKISDMQFYLAFYTEWYYLGCKQACEDYRSVCCEFGERFLLHSNPIIFMQTILRKVKGMM